MLSFLKRIIHSNTHPQATTNPPQTIRERPYAKAPLSLGPPRIFFDDIQDKISEFSVLHEKMPSIDNTYGMKTPHLFLMWNALKQLSPATIIESGIYKGLGTWWIEQACPNASLYCIDINLSQREYHSSRATYLDKDFSLHTWGNIDKDNTVIFFDCHQNALHRLQQMKWMGFSSAIFEDNYPIMQGDCYSCKKILSQSGFYNNNNEEVIPPNKTDAYFFKQNISCYQELPPVFKTEDTRWGDPWAEPLYDTVPPLLTTANTPMQELMLKEANSYTWMNYIELIT